MRKFECRLRKANTGRERSFTSRGDRLHFLNRKEGRVKNSPRVLIIPGSSSLPDRSVQGRCARCLQIHPRRPRVSGPTSSSWPLPWSSSSNSAPAALCDNPLTLAHQRGRGLRSMGRPSPVGSSRSTSRRCWKGTRFPKRWPWSVRPGRRVSGQHGGRETARRGGDPGRDCRLG